VVGRVSWLMDLCHVSCMVCVVVAVGLGSLVYSWDAGSVSVVARVDRANSSLGWVGVCPHCVVLRLVFGVVLFVPMV